MSETIADTVQTPATGLESAAHKGTPWYRNNKLDQWLVFWTVPVFFQVFGLVFVPLTWMMPPFAPTKPLPDIVEYMQTSPLELALALYMLTWGLGAVVTVGAYWLAISRMAVSPVLKYSFLIGQSIGGIVGALYPIICFGLGGFRPGYDPEIYRMLYDMAYLGYIGSLGCFCLPWMTLALCIILDKNRILPRWLGYYTAWQYVTELFAASVWIAHTGPFAWNGLLGFYFNMLIYVPWQIIIFFQIYKAIKNQPETELPNVHLKQQPVCN